MKLKSIRNIQLILQLTFVILIFADFFGMPKSGFYLISLICFTSVVVYMLDNKLRTDKKAIVVSIFFILLTIWGFYTFELNESSRRIPIYGLIGFWIAFICFKYRLTKIIFEYSFYFSFVSIFMILVLYKGQFDFNYLFPNKSRNIVSYEFLLLLIGYIISRIHRKKKISFSLCIFSIIFTFFMYGRSGIGMSLSISLLVLATKNKTLVLILGAFLLTLLIIYLPEIIEAFTSITRFSQGLNSPRFEMWAQYVQNLNLRRLFLGQELEKIPLIQTYGGNPHNAYIKFHALYGWFTIALMAILISSSIMMSRDRNFILLGIFFIYCIRALFDINHLFNIHDYIIMPLLFYPLFKEYLKHSNLKK